MGPVHRNYLASFRPLCSTALGRRVVEEKGLPPFIDGACRREPDLEHDWPAISALCRGANFAPRLEVGDRVAYITTRGLYGRRGVSGWRLVALLRVSHRFESHHAAAKWYQQRRLRLPSNCMVPENPPISMEATRGRRGQKGCSAHDALSAWDAFYQDRAESWPVMLVCEKLMADLYEPKWIEDADWKRWNDDRVPITQNPPEISDALWSRLEKLTGRSAA